MTLCRMQKQHRKASVFAFLCAAVLGCLLIAGGTVHANAAKESITDLYLSQVRLPQVLGNGQFTYDEVSFYSCCIPRYMLERFEASEYAIYPGQTDERVGTLKKLLNSDAKNAEFFRDNEFVTYTQIRPEVVDYFDEHLQTLLQCIYQFCGLEDKTPCVDELTVWLVDQLKYADADIRHDIEAFYKYRLNESGTCGTISRDGSLDPLYYFAQTDPDWANDIFEFEGNGATLKDRGCGCASAGMIFSAYHKVEITPKWMSFFALQDDYPVSYGLPNEYFSGIARYYENLEKERYGTVMPIPSIYEKRDVDMQTLADQIANKGYLAIIHVLAGCFTSHEHYMVLCDYTELDGVGYFLVADPYVMPSRYRDRDQLRNADSTNEGLIYATSDLLYRDMKSIILFEKDHNEFPLYCRSAAPVMLVGEAES